MIGKSYKHGRTIGRAGMNTDVRMSNRAESGLGMIGVLGIIIVLGIIVMGVM